MRHVYKCANAIQHEPDRNEILSVLLNLTPSPWIRLTPWHMTRTDTALAGAQPLLSRTWGLRILYTRQNPKGAPKRIFCKLNALTSVLNDLLFI